MTITVSDASDDIPIRRKSKERTHRPSILVSSLNQDELHESNISSPLEEHRKSDLTLARSDTSIHYEKMQISNLSSALLFIIGIWNTFISFMDIICCGKNITCCCKRSNAVQDGESKATAEDEQLPMCRPIETQLTRLYRDSELHVENQFDIHRIQTDLQELTSYL